VRVPLNIRPLPNLLVTAEARGLMNGDVHIGAESCARRPISLAAAFSRSIRAFVARSGGGLNLGDTESAGGRAPRRGGGGFGIVTLARTVSRAPDAFS